VTTEHPSGQPEDPFEQGLRNLGSSTERLIALVADLAARVDTAQEVQSTLSETVKKAERLQRDQSSQRRFSRWLAASIALDLMLTVGMGLGLDRVNANSDRIDSIQERTSGRVLCPLYELLVAQVENAPKDAADDDDDGNITAQEQAEYDRTVKVIRDGYAALECRRHD
jgi:hypothetical protein